MTKNRRKNLLRQIFLDLSLLTVIGVVLAIIGPFGDFEAPFALRLVNWLSLVFIGYVLYRPIDRIAVYLSPKLDLPVWGLRIAACLLATIPMAAVVYVLPYLPGLPPMPTPQEAVVQYGYVLVIGALITALFVIMDRNSGAQNVATASEQPPPPTGVEDTQQAAKSQPKFFERIPPQLGDRLIALEMEDHYVRVHTDLGSDLVLIRMRDAVTELAGIEGAQVHRSWWVARDAVTGSRKDGRNVRLSLEGDLEAPVSRNKVAELKERGWL